MRHEEFIELAALQAFDLLDAQERQVLQRYLERCPEAEAELAQFQSVAHGLAYAAPEVAVVPSLKQRLREWLARELSTSTLSPGCLATYGAALPWEPGPLVGTGMRTLYIDPGTREVVMVIRCEAGVSYPAHSHVSLEEILVLEGDLVLNGRLYRAGDYIHSLPGSRHCLSTQAGCVLFVRTLLDNEQFE